MEAERLEAIGRRIAAERDAAAVKRLEEEQYWAHVRSFVRCQRQEANRRYVFPVFILMGYSFCLGCIFMGWAGGQKGTWGSLLHGIGVLCMTVAGICFVVEMVLTDVQFFSNQTKN